MTTDPWQHDRLNRKPTGQHLIEVLLARYEARKAVGVGSYILNIDASWGEGKTFFLECLRSDLQQRGHAVAYVNAWQDDHADDPLVTVMSAIENALNPFFTETRTGRANFNRGKKALSIVAGETAKQVGLHLLKATTGIAADQTMAALKEAGALDTKWKVDNEALDAASEKVWDKALTDLIPKRVAEHQRANASANEFRASTGAAIEQIVAKGMLGPMFVFVDELDRCRPLYAIRLLEDLKHLFAIPGIVFVVATDSGQLAHSVKAIYGAEFEGRKYLRRFFDRVFVFPEAKRELFIRHILESHQIDEQASFEPTGGVPVIQTFTTWADAFRLSNRDVEQCMDIISTFVTSWEHPAKIEPVYLLSLVYLFYNHNITREINDGVINTFKDDLVRWIQPYQFFENNVGYRTQARSGHTMMVTAFKAAFTPLSDVVDEAGDVYRKVLLNERLARYPQNHGAIPAGAPTLSYLSEYPSRVINAGRVVKN